MAECSIVWRGDRVPPPRTPSRDGRENDRGGRTEDGRSPTARGGARQGRHGRPTNKMMQRCIRDGRWGHQVDQKRQKPEGEAKTTDAATHTWVDHALESTTMLYRYRRWRSRANPPSATSSPAVRTRVRTHPSAYAARRAASDVTRRGSRCWNCTISTGGVDTELISLLPLTPSRGRHGAG